MGRTTLFLGGAALQVLGTKKGVFRRKKPQTCTKWCKPLQFFSGMDKEIETSSKSDVSPCNYIFGPAPPLAHPKVLVKGDPSVNNQQLDSTPQVEPTTEESLRFARALEALGKQISGHTVTNDDMFAKDMAAYGRPMDGATCCPAHLDSAPPSMAVFGANTDWLSHSAVHSAHCLIKLGLPGLIASVQGEPNIHSSVVTLPPEAAPLLDQMRLKGDPVKIDGPPLTQKQLVSAIAYGSHNSCDRNPSFLRKEMRDFVEKGFWIVLPLEDAVGLDGL